MRKFLAGVLALSSVLAALAIGTPRAEAVPEEARTPVGSHVWLEDTYIKWVIDPIKAPNEKVLKVWIADHRAKRISKTRWVHNHVAQSDYWMHVEILTTKDRWSGWVYFGAEVE